MSETTGGVWNAVCLRYAYNTYQDLPTEYASSRTGWDEERDEDRRPTCTLLPTLDTSAGPQVFHFSDSSPAALVVPFAGEETRPSPSVVLARRYASHNPPRPPASLLSYVQCPFKKIVVDVTDMS